MKIIVVLFVIGLSSGCSLCSEKNVVEAPSPNGKYVAVVFERNCGATTSIFYHVNIRRSWRWFSKDSRGFNEDGQVFVSRIGNIKLLWQDDKTLSIECFDCKDDEYAKQCIGLWEDVKITCKINQLTYH